MARGGYTSTSDMTFDPGFAAGYRALAAAPSCPLRVSMWEVSSSASYPEPVAFEDPLMLTKAGVKLWTDGSPGSATSRSRSPIWTPRSPARPGSTRRRPVERGR